MLRLPFDILRFPTHWLRPFISQPGFWVLFFLSPLLNLFRVDVLAQQIVWLGQAYPFEHQFIRWIPIGFYTAVGIIAIISIFWGRVFCGWICPHNTLTEWTRPIRAMLGRSPATGGFKKLLDWLKIKNPSVLWPLGLILAFGLAGFLSFCLAAYLVSPQWLLESYQHGHPHVALVFGQALFSLIGLFLLLAGHDFCRACCPYGMAQSIYAGKDSRWQPLAIRFTGETPQGDCKTCHACQTACPVKIDPRAPENLKVGEFDGCFNCGECIDACNYVRGVQQKPGLLGWQLPRFVR